MVFPHHLFYGVKMPSRIANPLSYFATAVVIVAVVWLGTRGGILGTGVVSDALQILGLLIVVWARLTFGFRSFHFGARPTQGGLVTNGPYRYVRNPIYSGALLIIVTGVAVHASASNVALGVVAFGALVTRILCEEQLLPPVYPDYQDYAKKTPRLIPFLL